MGWNTSLRTAGENLKNTNEAAEKVTLDDEQETDETNEEEEEDEDGTSYSGESDEADDDF